MPLMNPYGYNIDWRYFNEKRDWRKGKSVSDSEHYLPNSLLPVIPRRFTPSSELAGNVTKWVLEKSEIHKPFLVVDHHEDEVRDTIFWDKNYLYAYASGERSVIKPICDLFKDTILKETGVSMQVGGRTRFLERIEDGWVINARDGSVDELLSSKNIIVGGRRTTKDAAKATFVIETQISDRVTMNQRIDAHKAIVEMTPQLWGKLHS